MFPTFCLLLGIIFAVVSSEPEATKDASVIILGAGVSGIQAAAQLTQQGITDILIIESTGRIGGRMWNEEWAGLTIELGKNLSAEIILFALHFIVYISNFHVRLQDVIGLKVLH